MIRYIVFDTCCFIYALEQRNIGFNYDEIKTYAAEKNAMIVISPYTLYEVVKQVSAFEDITNLRNQLIDFGDFYVRNQNGILEHEFLEYGIDFVFDLGFDRVEHYRDFGNKRAKFRQEVYKTLYNDIFIIVSLTAIIYLMMTDYLVSNEISEGTRIKIQYIDLYLLKEHRNRYELILNEYYKHAGLPIIDFNTGDFDKDYKAEEKTNEVILELVREFLALAEVELSLYKGEWIYNPNEYNKRIIDYLRQYKKTIKADSFTKINSKVNSKYRGAVNVDRIYETLMQEFHKGVSKDIFLHIIKRIFEKRTLGKGINNDLIDISNIRLIYGFPKDSAVYITTDKEWKNFILNSANDAFLKTKEFYKSFWIG